MITEPRGIFVKALALFMATVVSVVACRATPPSIESLAIPVLQAGQTSQIEFVGAGMNQVDEVVFYTSGLRCTKIDHFDDYKLLATIQADADCAIKSHAFRVRGENGFSELRTIRVSRFPIVLEEQRTSIDAAIDIACQSQTIVGTLQSGDYDRYAITLDKNQRLTVEAEAMRLGGDLVDTVLKVYGPQGPLLAVSDDNSLLRQDPAVSFIVPDSGRYVIELHESNYAGGSNTHYALHVGSFPASRVAYPTGGQIGTEVQVTFLEPNSLDSNPSSQTIALPQDDRKFQLFAGEEQQLSASPIPFRLSSFPNSLEHEPNDTLQSAITSYSTPIAFNGILKTTADVDCFAFDAEQNQPLRIEVFADRVGSPIDSFLQLFDPSGRLLAVNDDCDSNDSRIEFVTPWQGRYYLLIRDKLNRGFANGVYRIEVSPNQPRLITFLPRPDRISQRQQTIAVPQGNRVLAKVAVRRENLDGEVQLRFINLPAGVHSTPIYVAANEYWGLAILEADAKAPVGGRLAELVGTAQSNQNLVTGSFEHTIDLIAESADRLYQSASVDRLAVAVTPAMPFSIQIDQPTASLAVDGTLDLKIRLTRHADFNGLVRIDFPYLPDGCVGPPFFVMDSDQSQATYSITATKHALEGNFQLVAVATVSLSDGRSRETSSTALDDNSSPQATWNELRDREVASNKIDLHISPNPASGQFSNLAAELGSSTSLQCALRLTGTVPEELECQLEGLPKGVTAQPVRIESKQTFLTFDLQIASGAPLGKFSGIQCRIAGKLAGSQVSFVLPSPEPLVIAAKGKLMKADDGRVLSPLEALRKQYDK